MLLNRLLRTFLPTTCLLCRAAANETPNLCLECAHDLPRAGVACSCCGIPLGHTGICPDCQRNKPPYQRLHAAFRYSDGIRTLIHRLKFDRQLTCAVTLGEICADVLGEQLIALPDCIVPVPLHGQRLRDRGFNQALEIARPIARRLVLPLETTCIRRIRDTPAQTLATSRSIRWRNIDHAFVADPDKWDHRHVAVFDDVVTSGATVSTLASCLLQAGAARVDVFCCARVG